MSAFLLKLLPEWALMILRRVERGYGFCLGAMTIKVLERDVWSSTVKRVFWRVPLCQANL